MTNAPLFSLITITRDNLPGLRDTWASVEAQDCAEWEWLVVDGASADGTREWLAARPQADWVSEPDAGIYDAMNKGIARAGGDYLIFLNAGDALAGSGVLSGLGAAIAGAGAPDLVYGDSLEGADGRAFYKRARGHGAVARGMFTHHQAMAYRRAALGGLRYDTRYALAADYDLTARFLAGGARALYWPQAVCLFAPGGASQIHAARSRAEEFAIRRALGLAGPLMNRILWLRQWAALAARWALPSLYLWAKR